jgi:hypothetical protein
MKRHKLGSASKRSLPEVQGPDVSNQLGLLDKPHWVFAVKSAAEEPFDIILQNFQK